MQRERTRQQINQILINQVTENDYVKFLNIRLYTFRAKDMQHTSWTERICETVPCDVGVVYYNFIRDATNELKFALCIHFLVPKQVMA